MKIVFITGVSNSGKTTVLAELSKREFTCLDLDSFGENIKGQWTVNQKMLKAWLAFQETRSDYIVIGGISCNIDEVCDILDDSGGFLTVAICPERSVLIDRLEKSLSRGDYDKFSVKNSSNFINVILKHNDKFLNQCRNHEDCKVFNNSEDAVQFVEEHFKRVQEF